MKHLSSTFSIIQIPTEHDYQASEKRDNKQRGDIVIMLFRVLKNTAFIERFTRKIYSKDSCYAEYRVIGNRSEDKAVLDYTL
jgi:hypothetical protein